MPTGGGWAQDVVTRSVNVQWGDELYLYVSVSASNLKAGKGSVGSVSKPIIKMNIIDTDSVELIDQYQDPDSNTEFSGNNCLMYMPIQQMVVNWSEPDSTGWSEPIFGSGGEDFETAYANQGGISVWRQYYAADHGSCRPDQQYPQASETQYSANGTRQQIWYITLISVPVDFYSGASTSGEYLYKISAGDDIMEISITGIDSGSGSLYVSVYSTVRDKPTNLEKLVDIEPFDNETRLSPDDSRSGFLESDGTIKISIQLDSNPDHAQTDNYGKTFQPYKVIFDPAAGSVEHIPPQPPELLPLPSSFAMHKPGKAQMVSRIDDRRLPVVKPLAVEMPTDPSDWTVLSVNKTTNTEKVAVNDVTVTTQILDSITYYNSSTGQTVTAPIPT